MKIDFVEFIIKAFLVLGLLAMVGVLAALMKLLFFVP